MMKLVTGIGVAAAIGGLAIAHGPNLFAAAPPGPPRIAAVTPAPQAPAANPAPAGADFRSCVRGQPLVVTADRKGHFNLQVEIGHARGRGFTPMMIDTGASQIVLPFQDAQRLGISLDGARRARVSTANGMAEAHMVRLERVRIGPICFDDVTALVMPRGALEEGLIGMNVLRQLPRFEMARDRLVMAQ